MTHAGDPAPVSRRLALARIGSAGAGLLLLGPTARWRGASLRATGPEVDVTATAVNRFTLRLSIVPAGERERDAAIPRDGALAAARWAPPVRLPPASADHVTLGDFWVSLTDDPLTINVGRPAGRVVQDFTVDSASSALSFGLGDGPVLGLGAGGPQFDRRGSAYSMHSGQGGYRLRTHGGVVPIQWLVRTDGGALYVHQPLGTFDLQSERGVFHPPPGAPLPLDLFVVDATDPVEIMGQWALLTGQPEMPPLWSLGYQQSHRTLAGPDEVLWVARTFREKRLPCDTLIYLGTGFTPAGWNTLNGEFTWNPKTFPRPQAMLDQLHALHYHVVLHAVLEGRRLVGTVSDPCPDPPAPGATGSGDTWPDEQQVACYWPMHRAVTEQGVDGWWPDQGDGLDAPSRLARIRMYYEGMQLYRPNERPFALHRNGYAGMARYAAFLWSGDVYSTWETLRTHVSVAINAGLSGIPYWGTDIGGFVPTAEYTGELHVRWFQFGAFCPLFRAHGRTWHLRLPWGWDTGELGHDEIANYRGGARNPDASELHNPDVEPICRKYLELRYRLLPYLYTTVRQTHDTGLPIMRALWLHHPGDRDAAGRGDEYLWGRDILVAPVVERGATHRRLYLPRGVWHDFWTEEPVRGGREVVRAVDLATIPLYVRAGAILPLGPVKQYTSEPVAEPLTLVVYPGADGQGAIYEDDGHSFGYQRGDWMRILTEWHHEQRRLVVRLADGSRTRPRMPRTLAVRLAGQTGRREVVFDGSTLEVVL